MHNQDTASTAPPGFRTDLLRWRQLVQADWLDAWLRQQPVAAAPQADGLLLEVGCEGPAHYAAGHIPGAQFLDTRALEAPPFWNKVPDAHLLHVLQRLHLAPTTTVILYGRNMLAAARVAHLLLYAGVEDVRLLDGGLGAWCALGLALQTGEADTPQPRLQAAAPWPRFPAQPHYLTDLPQARALLHTPGAALVSIRSHAEWTGQTSGYPYIAARGEIAGALWGHAGQDGDVNSMSSFQDARGHMQPAQDIAAVWASAGIQPGMQLAFYCGTGWRASLAFFYAWLMGWPRISVFDGGWMEWSADAANAVRRRALPAQAPAGLATADRPGAAPAPA